MTQYPAVSVPTVTFLNEAITGRFLPMVEQLGAAFDPPIRQIGTYIEDRWTPPFAWIFPSGDISTEAYGNDELQVYGVVLRLVEANGKKMGFFGKTPQAKWLWLPTVTNYFLARRRLVYERGQREVPYFHEMRFLGGAPIDLLDPLGQEGLEFTFEFVFNYALKPFPGNT